MPTDAIIFMVPYNYSLMSSNLDLFKTCSFFFFLPSAKPTVQNVFATAILYNTVKPKYVQSVWNKMA